MSGWLGEAESAAAEQNYRTARRILEKGAIESTADHEAAARLADQLAQILEGRRKRQFEEISTQHRRTIDQLREEERQTIEARLRQRIVSNVFLFGVMSALDEENAALAIEWWRGAEPRITAWAEPLKVPFDLGYRAVMRLGPIPNGAVERAALHQLRTVVVNDVVIAHLQVFDDVRALRDAVPACFGYALLKKDTRARELVSRFEHLTGREMALPSEAASTTTFLDALERAAVARSERGYFRSAATAAYNVGIGAAVEDAIPG